MLPNLAVAEALAPHIGAVLRAPVHLDTVEPDQPLPFAVLVQLGASVLDTNAGTLAGRVRLDYVRTEHHREPNTEALLQALRVAGFECTFEPLATEGNGSQVIDSLGLRVTKAHAALPVIGKSPSTSAITSLGWRFAESVERSFRTLTSVPGLGQQEAWTFPVKVATGTPVVVSDRTTGSTRQVALEVTAKMSSSKHRPTLRDDLEGLATAQVGGFATGIGRITSASLTSTTASEHGYGLTAVVLFTLSSQLPEGQREVLQREVPVQVPVQRVRPLQPHEAPLPPTTEVRSSEPDDWRVHPGAVAL